MENLTDKLARLSNTTNLSSPFDDDEEDDEFDPNGPIDFSDYTEEEIGCADKSVRILPGVRRLVDSLPKDRFAVATSGAKTYCHGALHRAGIRTNLLSRVLSCWLTIPSIFRASCRHNHCWWSPITTWKTVSRSFLTRSQRNWLRY